MSKKKAKPAAKKAPKKAAKKAAKKSASKARTSSRLTAAATTSRTLTVTIFIYRTGNGNKIRTSPQRLYANPGDRIAWNVVNLIDGSNVPVTITWPEAGPWGKEPIEVRDWKMESFADAPAGRFKYTISARDAQEDPEIELPEGN
jgi:hypothetical protein